MLFSPSRNTAAFNILHASQYSLSGRKLRGTRPNIPWAADSWSGICSAASPSSRCPLRCPEEPGRWHQVGQRRLLCSVLQVYLCRGGGWHHTLYGVAEARLQPGKERSPVCRTFRCRSQEQSSKLLHSTWAELGLIAPLMWQVLEGLARGALASMEGEYHPTAGLQRLSCKCLFLAICLWNGWRHHKDSDRKIQRIPSK